MLEKYVTQNHCFFESNYPANINLFKVNNRSTRKRCGIYSELTITTSMMSSWCFYCELWTHFTSFSNVSSVDFEQVNNSWVIALIQAVILCEKQLVFWSWFLAGFLVVVPLKFFKYQITQFSEFIQSVKSRLTVAQVSPFLTF